MDEDISASLSHPAPGSLRRWVDVLLFLGIWVAAGLVLRLSDNAYLLLGVPLTIAFQKVVRRAPILALWVRQAPPFRLGWRGRIAAALLAILPVLLFLASLEQRDWVIAGWFLCAAVGAAAAGYSVYYFDLASAKALILCLLTAGTIGIAVFVFFTPRAPGRPAWNWPEAITWLLLYLPVVFVIEEVSFRGALDSHLHRPDDRSEWLSAAALSALWGLWHWPIVPRAERTLAIAVQIAAFHTAVGLPLSIYWRRSGNLLVPAFTHALVDAVRNGLGAGP
jgi:membrane protease YdiL (CAAX protease family)